MLEALSLDNFRTFKHLEVEQIGQINLVVGRNNVGKTSLLEAVWLWGHRGALDCVAQLLAWRDEWLPATARGALRRAGTVEGPQLPIKPLFHAASFHPDRLNTIRLDASPLGSLRFHWGWNASDAMVSTPPMHPVHNALELGEHPSSEAEAYFRATFNDDTLFTMRDEYGVSIRWDASRLNNFYRTETSLEGRLPELWDSVVLTPHEDRVVQALQIIQPDLERISFIELLAPHTRLPIVKTAEFSERRPLRSMGEGMLRLFALSLGLVHSRGALFLADDIDSGLHYSIQPDMWRMLFQTAAALKIQIFATTHSWDCIRAFQSAAVEHGTIDARLIRLSQHGGETRSTTFNADELAAITAQSIEVR